MPQDQATRNAIEQLRKVRRENSGRPTAPAPANPGDTAAAIDRLQSLLSGGGPMTDLDLLNAQGDMMPPEPVGKTRERLLGTPYQEPRDVTLPAEDLSMPMRIFRDLRHGVRQLTGY